MSWIGTVIGGFFGFALGGPIGMVAGLVFGHMIDKSGNISQDDSNRSNQRFYYSPQRSRPGFETRRNQQEMVYFVSVFSMLAKLCMVDGSLNEKSKEKVDSFIRDNLKLDEESSKLAHKIFEEALKTSYSFESFAQQFYQYFGRNRALVQTMIGILFGVSVADGLLSRNEERLIYSAGGIFGYSRATLDNFKKQYGFADSDLTQAYTILGLKENASEAEIKKAYHKLSIEFHPDMVVAKGLPEEFTKYATQKFQAINEAYGKIKKVRNIK